MRANNQSRLLSSEAIFEAGLIIARSDSPDTVFNFTTRTRSFEPPYVSKTLPIDHCNRGTSFIITTTRPPTSKLRDFEFSFRRTDKPSKYSRNYLLQSISVAAWTDLHFLLKLTSCSLKYPEFWFGDASPMSKLFGVNRSMSDVSLLIEVKGRLFKTDSTS